MAIIKSTRNYGKQLGSSGTTISGGFITAEDYNTQLSGKLALQKYEIMRRSDPTVHSLLMAIMLPIIGATWAVKAASEEKADQAISEYVDSQLFHNRNLSFKGFIREACSMLAMGFSVFEKTYGLTTYEGSELIGIKNLGSRKQRSIMRWTMDDGKEGIFQQLIGTPNANIPREKLIVFTNDKEGDNHEGISVLRYAYKDWDMKDKLGLVLAVGLEKMAIPVPVLGVPSGASQADVDQAVESIRQFRANEESYIKKPAGWELDKFDLSGYSTKEILPTLQYHDRQIVRTVLAQFLELGSSGGSGSRSLSEDHSRMFFKSLWAIAENLKETIQHELIEQLCDLNFTDMPNGYPEITVADIEDDNVTEKSDAVSKLMGTVLTANFETENALRSTLRLPLLTDEYREIYDKKFEAAKNGLDNVASPTTPDALPDKTATDEKPADKTITEDEKPKTGKDDKTIKAAVLGLKRNNRQLIDIILRD